ncbi:MAG: DEAD/DEAH box helicase [Rikenellaceae bacterium]
MNFSQLGVEIKFIEALWQFNIAEPLPIQQVVLPAVFAHQSIVAISQTGSGKTLSYLLPLVQLLDKEPTHRALILAPTRELAQQIGGVCRAICSVAGVDHCVIVGGVEYEPQRESLNGNPQIIVATPGRLIDLLEQGGSGVDEIDHFVLDEVDQMLDLGFKEPILWLAKLRKTLAQTLCFSATMPSELEAIVNQLSPSIKCLRIEGAPMAASSIEHLGYYVSREMMDHLLIYLLGTQKAQHSIIFTRSRSMADRLVGVLAQNAIVAEAMHSDRSQAAREHILDRFRSGQTSVIVATDVIARGIDIDTISHVFNFGLPQNPEQYIHRCGRCGRVGRSGRTISIFTPDERPILNDICRLMKRHILIEENHPYMTPDVTRALSGEAKKEKKRTNKRK